MLLVPEQVHKLSGWLDELIDLGPARRAVWFARLPAQHRELALTLRHMLAERDSKHKLSFLDSLPTLGDAADAKRLPEHARPGERVGPYCLVREIGCGGMGSVWLAERADGCFEPPVALKLPRLTQAAGSADRLAREHVIGAMLDHPHVAKLYEAGVDGLGRPYSAMEYIDGETIDVHCRQQHLPVRERVKLLVAVARAVAYVHGRRVVHRDLKPSNVMVSKSGEVRLLDFGIATLLSETGDSPSRLAQEDSCLLTPHYASPEQLKGEPVGIQTDVHGLGLLAFEVLTGRLPYGPITTKPSPSRSLNDLILQACRLPASRRAEEPVARRQLRGDLDAVLCKALKAQPNERYRSADALADDLQNWLDCKPVSSRSDVVFYRLKTAAKRFFRFTVFCLPVRIGSEAAPD